MTADPRPPFDPDAPPDHSWPAVRGRLTTLWRAARVVAGVVLVVVGILGLVLPVLPGIPLLIGGIALLGPQHPLVRPLVERIERWRAAARG
ncbi:MAG TPA: hypothetical protein VL049_07440 [Candidatus Dormibacteraeota bacterium]|nr:hypothetical protein [Candidatus Dormibacteraeota bacterium]